MGRRAVLVVDDEALMGEVIAEVLSSEGHFVDTASSGTDALRKLRCVAFDLVLCDVRMPGMDGPALYREVERLDRRLGERFVFLTGDTSHPETSRFLTATGVPCIAKPFQLEELQAVAGRRLGGGH